MVSRPLLQEGCEAVPHRATVYAQLVESELLWSWAQLQSVEVEGARMVPPPDVGRCAGAHSVCDIQLSQVSPRSFTPLGPLCTMFSVDFSKPVSSALQSHSSKFAAQSDGRAQVVLSWWDLDMDPSGSIVCTMAPSWTYPEPKRAPVSYRTRPCDDILRRAPVRPPLLISAMCFSGVITGCRAFTSCLQRSE